jgi:hypothetical protein
MSHAPNWQAQMSNSGLCWWWVRVLPPPGTLIRRFPGLIRPRCTAGATHRFAEPYYGLKLHGYTVLEDLLIFKSCNPDTCEDDYVGNGIAAAARTRRL